MKLKDILDTLPKYNNNIKVGDYKNGNYKGICIVTHQIDNRDYEIDLNNIESHFLDWNIKNIVPYARSVGRNNANVGLRIYIKETEII